jgi:hypothetical protein
MISVKNLPLPIVEYIKSYLDIWENFGISKKFISTLLDQLEWPRDFNFYANSSITYYSNIRLSMNCDFIPVHDSYFGNYNLVKHPYKFNFRFKETF